MDDDTHSAESEARELVRSFSDKLQTKEPSSRTDLDEALQKGVEDYTTDSRRRRQAFQTSAASGSAFDRANLESEKIQKAWAAFVVELEDGSDAKPKTPWRSKKKSASVDTQIKALEVSTIDDVLDELEEVQTRWVGKDRLLSGKIQGQFHKCCTALSQHDIVFDLIPNQNNYAATLCGSLRMMIRASANHVRYAEELGQVLDDISDEIGQSSLLLAVMKVPEMEQRVEELYVLIFHLFRRAMSWYQSSGFRKIRFGLNEGLYDKLKEDVSAIKNHALSIQRDAQARGLVENRETRLIAETTAIDSRKTLIITEAAYDRLAETQQAGDATLLQVFQMRQQLEREREERRRDKNELHNLLLTLGQQLADGLTDQAVQVLIERANYQRRISEVAAHEELGSSDYRGGEPSSSDDCRQHNNEASKNRDHIRPQQIYRRDDLMLVSQHLDDSIVGLDERDLTIRKSPSLASHGVASKLQAWSRSGAAQRLWLFGPAQYGVPSGVVGAAVNVLQTSLFLKIPVIAHACDRSRISAKSSTREESGVIGLTYSLIRQLIALLPDETRTDSDFSKERFGHLDGSSKSWLEALDVLSDLLACAPPLLLCLLDGLNRLESGAAVQMCEDLLDRLDESMDSDPDNERVVKLLFTSSGNCQTLRDWLDRREIYMVEDAPPTRQSSNNLGDGTTPLVLRDVFEGGTEDD